MKVKELIEKLLDVPMDKEVWFCVLDEDSIKIDDVVLNVPQDRVCLK